ncbi:flagellar hook-length control protein FliK [Marinobacter sp. LN3S78]|uniref:flagellar hook-length control protein FliK n=1 Tax=Marinobacter sp. LN3S78 TaxID=3382300 RepID=UPI00387AE080
MSGMVLNQLLTPESGTDRPGADKALDGAVQGRPESGPSRYDEVVRQQEKRLEQRRAEERSAQRKRDQEDLRQKQDAAKADTAKAENAKEERANRSAEENTQAARDSRPESDRDSRTSRESRSDGDGPDTANANASEAKPDKVVDDVESAGIGLLQYLRDGDETGMTGLMMQGQAVEGAGVSQGKSARTTAQMIASLTGTGQQPGGLPKAGALFAAMLEAGQDKGGKQGRELLAGLQAGGVQALTDSATRSPDTLTAQVASRLTAPELTQSLNQPATLRGQEAQALMRNYSTSVDVPVGADEWGEKVMGKLAWLTASQMSVAEIHVTPPDLGPLEVRVQVQNDQATVTVHTSTPAVREQLELHGHRLRDMLNEQGLSLDGFDVSDSADRDRSEQNDDGDESANSGPGQGLASGDADTDATEMTELDLSWKGELDVYA